MFRLTLILFLSLMASPVFGQKLVDSLRSELSRAGLSDSLRADLYNELAFAYAGINPVIGHAYADSAWALATDKGLTSRATSAINYHGVNYWYQGEDSLALVAYRQVLAEHQRLRLGVGLRGSSLMTAKAPAPAAKPAAPEASNVAEATTVSHAEQVALADPKL